MATRVLRRPDDAKRLILEAASTLLAAGGPAAVQVRAVAAEVSVSDAAVNHHFGTRERLLESLLRFGGVELKAELHTVLNVRTNLRWAWFISGRAGERRVRLPGHGDDASHHAGVRTTASGPGA
ncbi:TetR family transcriptional regulator [Nonomuraea dietziae]|uniref:TetR family transcriptional regulator n=1 Tax=Nonomuraea dietziae TaxID=65515 RepID=UPI003448B88B